MIADLKNLDPKIHAPTAEQLAYLDHAFLPNNRLPINFKRRDKMSLQELGSEVTTLGWDTTYCLRVSDVNSVLKKSDVVPKKFDILVDPDENYKANGDFGPWQIGLGGSGAIIFLAIPIPTGTLYSGPKEYSMANSKVYISVKLKYIPQIPIVQPENNIFQTDNLLTDTLDRSETDPAVVVQHLIFDGTPPSAFVKALMIGALQEWFNKNLVQFAYIFSTVNLNEKAADGNFQWVKPTYTGYGYQDGNTEENAILGVLNMTGGRSPDGLSNQLAPGSIPSGSRAGFNISLQRYMVECIFPGLVKGFPNASPSSFSLKNNNTIIENLNKDGERQDIKCEDVQVGLIWYTPIIKEFVLQVIGSEIQVYTKTVTEISPGIRSVVINTTFQTIVAVTKADGSQTLDYKETQPPRTNSFIEKDDWILITEIVVSIAGAIAGVVAAVVIKGAVKIILACVIIAIVFSLAAATPALIAAVAGGGAASQLPPINLMILNATAPVIWPGGADFTLDKDGVYLNGAFQMGGNPHIVPLLLENQLN